MYSFFNAQFNRKSLASVSEWVAMVILILFLTTVSSHAQDTPANNQSLQIPDDTQSITHGKGLFGQHCSACHRVDKQIIGPALASVHGTRPTDWLLKFIKNSQEVIADPDDEYAQQLFSQYNEQIMPAFEFLSDDDILSILSYIKDESVADYATGSVGASGNANVDGSEAQEEISDGRPAFPQDDDTAEAESIFTGSTITILVIFVVALIGLIVAVIYLSKGRGNRTHKTKA